MLLDILLYILVASLGACFGFFLSALLVGSRGRDLCSPALMLIAIAEQGIIIVGRGQEEVKSLFPAWRALLKEDAEPSYKGKVLAVMTVRVLREDKRWYYGGK